MHRHSSRRVPSLGKSLLAERLRGARSYDRIAVYFSSSILEVAGEELESMSGKVRIICNSELDPDDVKSARGAAMAVRREWCRRDHEKMAVRGAAASKASPLPLQRQAGRQGTARLGRRPARLHRRPPPLPLRHPAGRQI